LSIQGILMQQCLCSKHAHGGMMYEQQSCSVCSVVITQDCSCCDASSSSLQSK